MEVSGQLHTPSALSPVPGGLGAEWAPRAGLDAVAKNKIPCPRREPNPVSPVRRLKTTEWISMTVLQGVYTYGVKMVEICDHIVKL